MNKQVSSIWVILSVVLIIFIGILIGYVYWQRNEIKDFKEQIELENEREKLEEEYTAISQEYNLYNNRKVWLNNDPLIQQLDNEKMRIQHLLEELRTRKNFNAIALDSMHAELKILRGNIRIYQNIIDSLSNENRLLQAEKNAALNRYKEATQTAAKLHLDNIALNAKMEQAARLSTSNMEIMTLNKRGRKSNDNDKIERIKINFIVDRNIIAIQGDKNIYVCIIKPDGLTLVKDRTNSFVYNNTEKYYSMHQIIDYTGNEEKMYFLWKVEEYLPAGEYVVEIYADTQLINTTSFILEE